MTDALRRGTFGPGASGDLADLGVTSVILDGRVEGSLERAVAGEEVEGTVVSAHGLGDR